MDIQIPVVDDPTSGYRAFASPDALRRRMSVLANAGATSITAVGLAAPTEGGTVTSADGASGPLHDDATATTQNAVAGPVSAFTVLRRDWNPEIAFLIQTGAAVTTTRYLVGAVSASTDAVPTPATIHGAWFRFDTSLGDTTWKCCTAAGGAPTVVDSGIPVNVGMTYLLRMELTPTSVNFYIGPMVVATITATLPTATTLLGYQARVTALAALAARSIRWSRIFLGHV